MTVAGGCSRWQLPQRCETCGAPDSRDRRHARGCPSLPPPSRESLIRAAKAIETAWARAAGKPNPHAAEHGKASHA
jgi:hypothetical protein